MTLADPSGWFRFEPVRPYLTLITEPHAHLFFRANMWLIEGAEDRLLVDCGNGLAPLAPLLPQDKPLTALVTHAHVDHVGALHEFAVRLGPAESAAALATMEDGATLAPLLRDHPEPVSRPPSPGWSAQDFRLRPAPLTRALREGDRVSAAGHDFAVLALPGHSPDSIGLWDEARSLLVTGDALYEGGLVDDLPHSDRAAYRRTMERLMGLEPALVLPGHGAPLDARRMREIAAGWLARDSRKG